MKIAFALPCSGRYPIGGFRIIYEHANRLASKGHDITIFHATDLAFSKAPIKRKLTSSLRLARNKATGLYLPTKWFLLDQRIATRCAMTLGIGARERFDAVIATGWQTAAPVAKLRAGEKYYFIQHFEDWDAEAEAVLASWKLPLTKIAISRWLKRMIESLDEECVLVPNAIDATFFYPTRSIRQREAASILLQLHPKAWKGTEDALAAIKILRGRGHNFRLDLFGVASTNTFDVEGAFTYHRNPSQAKLRDLYSNNAIFVAASWSEGWGLTPHEACACGAAVAATDIDGHREFLKPDQSALLSPPRDPQALANNIEKLLDDQILRMSIAHNGHQAAAMFTWDKTSSLLESILCKRRLHDSNTQS